MKNKISKKEPRIHPNAQLIITGKSITFDQAHEVVLFCQNLSIKNWCSKNGTIGYIDSIQPNTTYKQFYEDLTLLSQNFVFLDLGITIMTGPPKTYTEPQFSFSIKNMVLKREFNPHMNHSAPKRIVEE